MSVLLNISNIDMVFDSMIDMVLFHHFLVSGFGRFVILVVFELFPESLVLIECLNLIFEQHIESCENYISLNYYEHDIQLPLERCIQKNSRLNISMDRCQKQEGTH